MARHCSRCRQVGHDRRKCTATNGALVTSEALATVEPVKLQGSYVRQSAPTTGRMVQPKDARRWTTKSLGGTTPETISSILSEVQRGYFEQWADLCSYMQRTDPHVRSVLVTRLNAVASAELDVTPGKARAGDEQLAEEAAHFYRECLEETPGFRDRLADLLYGGFVGFAVLEHDWSYRTGYLKSAPQFIHPRDIRLAADWTAEVRTFSTGVEEWLRTAEHPHRFVVHAPHNVSDTPANVGEFHSIVWAWFFKRWLEKYQLSGMERLANGFMYGLLPENATAEVQNEMHEGLESIAADGVATFRVPAGYPDPVKLLMPSGGTPGQAWRDAIHFYNQEISKAFLGSGLNVEVDSTGGNRALGESQFDTTILPRFVADARRVCSTIDRDWGKPLLAFNTHVFGGRTPPMPRLALRLVSDDAPETVIDQLAIDAGVVRKDELRKSRGLEPLGPDQGGDAFVVPIAKTPPVPGFARVEAVAPPGGADEAVPFSRTKPTSSETSSRSEADPLRRALSRK